MHISKVSIKGYKSLTDVSVNVENYTCLIGKNDSGKSTFLRALQALFDPEYLLSENDRSKIEGCGDECFIEAVLSECGNRPPLVTNDQICIRRIVGGSRPSWQYKGRVPSSDTLGRMQHGDMTRGKYSDDKALSSDIRSIIDGTLNELKPSGAVPKEIWQTAFNRAEDAGLVAWEEGWSFLDGSVLPTLVQVVMLEADARGEEETKDTTSSVFNSVGGKLLHVATQQHEGMAKATQALRTEIEAVSTKSDSDEWPIPELNHFKTILNEEVGRFASGITVSSTLVPPRIQVPTFGLTTVVGDGVVEGLDKMGHGLRRSVVYAMLRTHRRLREQSPVVAPEAEQRNAPPLYLFLIEEPELYLHPQAERERKRDLHELSKVGDTQVVLCTHSAFFVDLQAHKGILRFSRPDRRETTVRGWHSKDLNPEEDKMLSLIKFLDPQRAAMMFADTVILVEGECERAVIPFWAERWGLQTRDVEVVDCKSNTAIPICQRILEGFGIRYVAWLDDDKPEDGTETHASKEAAELIATVKDRRTEGCGKIIITPGNWERMNGINKHPGKKRDKTLKHFIYDENEPNALLATRIRAAYNFQDHETDLPTKTLPE